jgi:hypothetical protein
MFTRPEVGKTVTVTTDWSDYYSVCCEYVSITRNKNTQTGVVVKSEGHDDPASFRITTGKAHYPVAIIPLKRVTALKYSDGVEVESKEVELADEEEWDVAGSKGSSYTVTRKVDTWHCECMGWQFRQQCKHVNAKKEEVLNRD